MKTTRILFHSIAAILLSVPTLTAAPNTISGADPDWSSGFNWSLGARPGIGDNAVISASGTINVDGSLLGGLTELQDLTFDNATGTILANGSATDLMNLTLNGGRGAGVPLIQTIGDAAHTIQGPGTSVPTVPLRLTLKSSGDVNVTSADQNMALTISSDVVESGGARSLRKTGAGRLVLSGTNAFSGGLTIASGVVEARNNASLASSVVRTIQGTGTVTLAGGTLQVRDNGTSSAQTIQYNNNIVVQNGGGSINVDRVSVNSLSSIQFGTLSIGAQTLSFSSGNNYRVRFSGATTLTGNATFDVGSGGSQVMQVFMFGGVGGAFDLTKTGSGTFRMNAATNAISGQLNVNGGTLALTGTIPNSPRIHLGTAGIFDVGSVTGGFKLAATQTLAGAGGVAGGVTTLSGATLQPGGANGIGTLNFTTALTLGSVAGDTTSVNFASLTNSPKLNVSVSNGLIANGGANSVTFNVGGGAPPVGTYPLIDYLGTLGGTGFSAFKLGTLPARVLGAALVNNAANTSIDLSVTAIEFPIWKGALSNEWTSTTQSSPKNWVLNSNNATATDFLVNDNATFNDLGTQTTVNIGTTDVSPGAVVFENATKNYTITGTKAITGIAGITKNGAGKATIANTNTFFGNVTMNAGTLSVATITDGGVAGPLGSGAGLNFGGGTLEYTGAGGSSNRAVSIGGGGGAIAVSDALTLTGGISGTGTFTKAGAGTLTLTGSNTGIGATVISAGTLEIVGSTVVNAAAFTTNGTLSFNQAGARTVTNVIGGTGGVLFTGTGTFTMGGVLANTYTGPTVVADATLIAGKGAGTTAISGDLIINAGGVFRYLNNNVSNQIANSASIVINGGTFGDPNTTAPTDPGATDTVANVTVNGGVFASGRNVTPGPFTITGALNVFGGGIALAQRAGIITANSVVIGDGSVNMDGGSTTANAQSRLNVGAGGLTLTGGTINFNAGPSGVGGASQGSVLRLAGNVTSAGTSQLVRLNPGVSNAVVDLAAATRIFNVEGTLHIGTVDAPVGITNGSIEKTGSGLLSIGGAQTYTALTAQAGTTTFEADHTLTGLTIADGAIVKLGGASPALFGEAGAALSPAGGVAAVPEPGALALLWLGGCAIMGRRRRS